MDLNFAKPADTVHNCSINTVIMSVIKCVHALTVCFDCDATGLVDEQQKVRTISALAIAALAEAATPYGIESFDSVLKPLWKGIRQHRGKVRSQEQIAFIARSTPPQACMWPQCEYLLAIKSPWRSC